MTKSPTNTSSDPRNCYPRSEFEIQPQKLPGHENKMNPKPDHAEHSYQGHERLIGKVALITGGDGGIGKAVALAYVREGANIVFTYLSEKEDVNETEQLIMDQSNNRPGCDQIVEACIKNFDQLDFSK